VVLGAYESNDKETGFRLTRTADEFNKKTDGRLKEIMKM